MARVPLAGRPDVAAIPLGRMLPSASCNLPGRLGRKLPEGCLHAVPIRSCSRWGLPCRFRCRSRGGLLPHPFTLAPLMLRRHEPCGARGGLLSVALSLGSPPPDVIRHRVSSEPGLSSRAAFRRMRARPPGRLVSGIKVLWRQNARPFRPAPPEAALASLRRPP